MKLSLPRLVVAFIIPFLSAGLSRAQTTSTLPAPPPKIIVDGDAKEWGDSLRYYNAEKGINYSLANTRDTLYMAVCVNDHSQQVRILRSGLTFTIDPKGKKKDAFSITFPLTVQGGNVPLQSLATTDDAPHDVTQQDRDELMRERITTLRGIKATGFKDIEDEMITTSNTYGIQAAVNYDDKGYLVCEAAIPMKFFHADDPTKNEWSFNFKINGIQHKPQGSSSSDSGGGGGRGGRGGGMGGGGGRHGGRGGGGGSHTGETGGESHEALFKSEDFWAKYFLAK